MTKVTFTQIRAMAIARLACGGVVLFSLFLHGSAAWTETYRFEEGVDGYSGFRDTTIFQDLPANAGGGITGIFSGTIRTSFLRRALIAVDLTAIPTDAVVVSARLEMVVERSGGNFGDIAYGLHRLQRDWGEGEAGIPGEPGGLGDAAAAGDATWTDSHYLADTWDSPGGDFAPAPSATANAGQQGATVLWESTELAADVQAWVAHPESNFGWAIITPEEGVIQRVKKFSSSEATANRPVLIVETEGPSSLPGSPESSLLFWLGLLWLLRWWFRNFRSWPR